MLALRRRLFTCLCLLALAPSLNAQKELAVGRVRLLSGDLPSVQVLDPLRGTTFRVYFDSISEPIARRSIPLLSAAYAALAVRLGAEAGMISWAAVAFVRDTAYQSPRIPGEV